jgi:hypothetical protein
MDEVNELSKPDQDAAIAYMSRHFVALMCECEVTDDKGNKQRGVDVFSGFLLNLHGHGFWVTAGHCFKDNLDAKLQAGRLRVIGGSFLDHFGHEPKFVGGVPYTYELGDSFYIEDSDMGLDFAIIKLDSLQTQAFLANDLLFISRENWLDQPQLKFDSYLMLGLVGDPRLEVKGSQTILHNNQAMIPARKIGHDEIGKLPPELTKPPSEEWFVGRIPQNRNIPTIQRMSVGPIYGFRYDDQKNLRYHVVALQSRWWTKSRTIFGCPLALFGEWCYQQLKRVLAEMEIEDGTT